jgi:septum formation protein
MVQHSVVLMSASPRRAELLRLAGVAFRIHPVDIDETPLPGEAPGDLAERLARCKAARPAALPSPSLAIGADTVVAVGGDLLGKPRDLADARRMLRLLAGRWHEVVTAVAVRAVPEEIVLCRRTTSRVLFVAMSEDEISWYAASGEGMDKAGAYALQGKGALFVSAIEGSYTNVIGLPMETLYPLLRRFAVLPPPAGA